jgi:hypothetical protein
MRSNGLISSIVDQNLMWESGPSVAPKEVFSR